MQGNINPANRGLAVTPQDSQKRIKRRSRVRIQESLTQPRLANSVSRLNFFLVPGISETRFPVPCLKVIAKFGQLTAQSDIEEDIIKRGRRKIVTRFQGAIADPGIYGVPGEVSLSAGIVAFATVNGLNGFWIGTLMPTGPKRVPVALWNGSGKNGVGA